MIFVQCFMISAIKIVVEKKCSTLRNIHVSLTQRLTTVVKTHALKRIFCFGYENSARLNLMLSTVIIC